MVVHIRNDFLVADFAMAVLRLLAVVAAIFQFVAALNAKSSGRIAERSLASRTLWSVCVNGHGVALHIDGRCRSSSY